MSAALVTDTTADLPPELAAELGIEIAAASIAFRDHTFVDGTLPSTDFYARLEASPDTPVPSSPAQEQFTAAFTRALDRAERALCLLAPLGVTPTYTNANAAALVAELSSRVTISNPGVASAGLCALLVSLGTHLAAHPETNAPELLALVDDLSPRCDTLFVPASIDWLEQAGHLRLIQDRTGVIEDETPIVRVGTRITGVALAADQAAGIAEAAKRLSGRLGEPGPVVAVIDHAGAPDRVSEAERLLRESYDIARLVVTELSPTIGAQVGPGAVGLGIAPLPTTTGA